MDRDRANDYLVELVGASNDDGQYEAVPFEPYVTTHAPVQSDTERGATGWR